MEKTLFESLCEKYELSTNIKLGIRNRSKDEDDD